MTKLTIKDIRNLGPCYDPNKYMKDTDVFTVQQILRNKKVPPEDRLWVVCREEFINKELLFKFAENCCWQVVHILPEKEQLEYCNILSIIRLARETDDNELRRSARASAWASAWDSVWYSARDSVRASARYSARASARASARDSARDSAWNSAWNSARYEFCLMLADMVDGKMDMELDKMFLMDRLQND